MPSLMDTVREFGKATAYGRSTLPKFALHICREAAAGEISEDDANDLYLEYIKTSTGVSMDATANSVRANASKLRQIIKLGAECSDAETLLTKVIETHDKMLRQENIVSAYAAMVAAARERLTTGKHVPDRRIVQLMTKHTTRKRKGK